MSWRIQELELEQIALWPRSAKLLLFACSVALLAIVGSYFFIAEHWRLWQQGRAEEVQLKRTFEHKAGLAARWPTYQQQLTGHEQALAIMQQQIPEQRDTAPLLSMFSALAQDNGLRLTDFQWQAERPRAQARELPLQLTLEGGYHQLGLFVAQVSALPRLVVIDNFMLTRANAHSNSQSPLSSQPVAYLPPALELKPELKLEPKLKHELNQAEPLLIMRLTALAYVYQPAEIKGKP